MGGKTDFLDKKLFFILQTGTRKYEVMTKPEVIELQQFIGGKSMVCLNKIPALFSIHEKELREKIDNNDSPFLGLFADFFKETTRNELIKLVHDFSRPVDDYIWNFHGYPALLATLMTVALSEKFGESGHFQVYPHIERLLNKKLSQSDKHKLWQGYRKACMKLGLSVSPRTSGNHYIVDEFIRQAGLPMRYVSDFCERTMKYTDRVGLPDENNPEELKLWQQELVHTLKPPFPKTAKNAIQRDENSYYAGMFIFLYCNRNQNPKNFSRLEKRMLDTIARGPQSSQSGKKARIPQVVFRNFLEYGVLFPPEEMRTWQLDTGGDQSHHTTRGEELFVPFDGQTLPPSVTLTDDTGISWNYTLWKGGETNRLLIFALPSGELVQSAALPDEEISLEPGEYALMLRFSPRGEPEVEQFNDDPELFIKKRILLTPGDSKALCYGPAKLVLKADEMPLLLMQTRPFRGVRGNAFYPSKELTLQIVIPNEMKEREDEFLLQLRSNQLGEEIDVPVKFGNENQLELDLDPWIEGWKPGAARVQLVLKKNISGRLVTRRSIVIWNGLKTIDDRCAFRCDRLPENISKDYCENLKLDEKTQTCSYRDETNRFFKISFKDAGRFHEFVWAVPGIFLGVVDYSDGRQTEKSIAVGATVSVKSASRKMLKIYSTAPAAFTMGDYFQSVNFKRSGSFTIPLANLQEHIGSGTNTLDMTCKNWSAPLPLIHLVSPFTATHFHCDDEDGGKKWEIELAESIQGIRIIADNLLDGLQYETEFSNITLAKEVLMPEVIVSCFWNSSGRLTLYVSGHQWPPGLWRIFFYVKASGRWGMLTNDEHHFYADGQMAKANVVHNRIHAMFSALCRNPEESDYHDGKPDGKEALEMFHRLQHALFPRYAAGIWHRLVWMEKVWTMICKVYLSRSKDGEMLSSLLQLSTQWRENTLQEEELPSLHLGARLPLIYGLHRNQYRIKGKITSSMLSVFSIMPRMGNLAHIFSKEDLDLAALSGFSNFVDVSSKMVSPRGFSLDTYREGLTNIDFAEKRHLLFNERWIPGKGDYLGPVHYQYAVMKLKDAFKKNMNIYSRIRGKALSMVRKVSSKTLRSYCADDGIVDAFPAIDLGLWEKENGTEQDLSEEEATAREHYELMIRFLSLFAQVCRMECRQPGTIDTLLDSFENFPGLSAKECLESLAFLLYTGEDLFAFYLLLWEMIFTADYSNGTNVNQQF